ncbi:cold-shock DNA-binding domain protein [Chytridium lagenaria]|nr:cold-shock DNA-binding domain protein [Chytridium lagenaria]
MDFELPDHTHTLVRLSELNGPTVMDRRIGFDQGNDFGYPLILIFIRGFFCPKDQEQLRQIVKSWEELKVSYAKVAVVSVDPPLVNGAFRAGLGAEFTFFSDEGGMITRRLGLLDNTEGEYPGRSRPYTLVLDGKLKIKKSYDGWWFAGRPTIEELRKEIRNILSRRTSYRFDAWTKPEVTSVRIPADVWAHGLIPIPSRGGSEATGTVRWFDPALGQGAIVVANNYWTRGRGTISWMDFMGNINNDSNLLEGGEGGNSGNAAAAGTNANGATVVPGAPSIDDEVFFHFTAIPGVGSRSAKPGQKVRFELLRHKNCWIGFNVQPLPDDGA